MSTKSESAIANNINFPDWAPKELISEYVNSPEPDPTLKLLLTHDDMKLAWEGLRKAGMTDSPNNNEGGYIFIHGARKTPMGLYEYISQVKNAWEQKALLNPSEIAVKLSKLKSAAEDFISLIKDAGFDLDHKIVADYAKYKNAEHWTPNAKDELVQHLRTRVDYPEISISELIQAYVKILHDDQQTKIYHSPTISYKKGEPTFFAVLLSNFMRDFYARPLYEVVANILNAILDSRLVGDEVKTLVHVSKKRKIAKV